MLQNNRQYHKQTKQILLIEEKLNNDLKPIFHKHYSNLKHKFLELGILKIQEIYLISLNEELKSSNKEELNKALWSAEARLQGISYELFNFSIKNHWIPGYE